MYSIVLLMAASTAPEAVDFGGRFGCGGGCYGSCFGSSWSGASCFGSGYGGSCYGSCFGSGYGGSCYGSSCHGFRFIGGHASCHGSSCYGSGSHHGFYYSSCNGCYGSCYGSSCYGSSYGSSCHGYGIYGGASYHHSAYPLTSGSGCYGYGMPQIITPHVDMVPSIQTSSIKPTADKAVVSVKLPADATLYADGQKTTLTSAERTFLTPALTAGQRYTYELKVEYVREGKPVTDAKKIFVKAGERTEVEFADKASQVEKASSSVTVILPADAKLIVDQVANEGSGTKREFRTPELPRGRDFQYTFRAEVVREGKKDVQTQKVIFKAGEPIRVDFSDLDSVRTVSK